jgi:hypothetical protein
MSENEKGETLVASWLSFAHMLRDLQSKAKDLELSNFSLSYGAGTEKEFRSKLREIEILVGKMVALIGPETSEEPKTLVS